MQVYLLCLFAAVSILVAISNGQPPEFSCMGTKLTMNDKFKATQDKCWNKLYPGKSMEEERKSGNKPSACLPICYFKEIGLITAENKFDKNQLKAAATYFSLPQEAADQIVPKWTTCIDEKGSNLDIKDGKCDSAEPVVQCMFDGVREVCDKKA